MTETNHDECAFLKDKTKFNEKLSKIDTAIVLLSSWKIDHQKDFDKIPTAIQELRDLVFLQSADITEIKLVKDDIKQILELLNGNGKLGICGKVSILWASTIFIVAGVVAAIIRTFF